MHTPRSPLLACPPPPTNQSPDSPNSYKLPTLSLPLPHWISRPHPLSPKSGQPPRVFQLNGRAQELWKTDRQPPNPLSHRHRNPPPRTSSRPPHDLCTAASSATSDREPQRQPLRPRLRGETRDPSHASPTFLRALLQPPRQQRHFVFFFHPVHLFFSGLCIIPLSFCTVNRPGHRAPTSGTSLCICGRGSVEQALID